HQVRLAQIDLPDGLVYPVAEHIPVDQQHVCLAVPVSLQILPPVQGTPQGHGFSTHLIRLHPRLAGQELPQRAAKVSLVTRVFPLLHPEAPVLAGLGQKLELYAFSAAIDALDGDHPGFFHCVSPCPKIRLSRHNRLSSTWARTRVPAPSWVSSRMRPSRFNRAMASYLS